MNGSASTIVRSLVTKSFWNSLWPFGALVDFYFLFFVCEEKQKPAHLDFVFVFVFVFVFGFRSAFLFKSKKKASPNNIGFL